MATLQQEQVFHRALLDVPLIALLQAYQAILEQLALSQGRERRIGLPISLLDVPEYHEKTERVRSMYATTNAQEAWNIARSLHIDYVYIDSVERAGYSAGMAKFEDRQYFAPAFRNAEVSVYRVE